MLLGFLTELTALYFFVKGILEGTVFQFFQRLEIMFVSRGWLAFLFAMVVFTVFTYLVKKDKRDGKEEDIKEQE